MDKTTLLTKVSVRLCESCRETDYEVCRNCEKYKLVNELLLK